MDKLIIIMADLNPKKLHITKKNSIETDKFTIPRKYTLTHSDSTGELFLTIGEDFDLAQISGRYTRFMRDEVLAEWQKNENEYELHVHVHVSGGFTFGWASMRERIFRHHMPLVLQTIRYGDKDIFNTFPFLDESLIFVHFKSKKEKYNKIEEFGLIKEYKLS